MIRPLTTITVRVGRLVTERRTIRRWPRRSWRRVIPALIVYGVLGAFGALLAVWIGVGP